MNDALETLLLAGFREKNSAAADDLCVLQDRYEVDVVCIPGERLQLYGKALNSKIIFDGKPMLLYHKETQYFPWAARQSFISPSEQRAFVDPFKGLWGAMQRLCDEGCTITCSMQPPPGADAESEEVTEMGLRMMHEVSLEITFIPCFHPFTHGDEAALLWQYTVMKLTELEDRRPGNERVLQQVPATHLNAPKHT